MDAFELESLRDAILESMQRYPRGISVVMLAKLLKAMTFELEEKGPDSLEAQLSYLKSKGFIEPAAKGHTPSNEIWKLTAEGDDLVRSK